MVSDFALLCWAATVAHCTAGRLQVKVLGSLVPPSIFGRLTLLCAILRQLLLIFSLILQPSVDVFLVDQLSAGIPLLRFIYNTPVVFYCHFPDLLLNPARGSSQKVSSLRKLYRYPLDALEESTSGLADRILVNSAYTAAVFRNTFKTITIQPDVLHPSIDVAAYNRDFATTAVSEFLKYAFCSTPCLGVESSLIALRRTNAAFVSINRYEGKKNLDLAVKAFALALKSYPNMKYAKLIIAGGWDSMVKDNAATSKRLEALAAAQGLTTSSTLPSTAQVIFLRNISDDEKLALLRSENSLGLLYTPPHEHFGIVPLEAMACGLPVLACETGGPKESVQHDRTGVLLPADSETEWAKAMCSLTPQRKAAFGAAGRQRAEQSFSLSQMSNKLESVLAGACAGIPPRQDGRLQEAMIKVLFVLVMPALLLFFLGLARFTSNKCVLSARRWFD